MDELAQFQSLLAQVRDGSEEAARQLYETYGQHVMMVVRRNLGRELRSKFDSLDFAQAVWASFFADRAGIVDLPTPENLIGYLAGVARNKVVAEYRRRMNSHKYNVRREQDLPLDGEDHGIAGRSPTPSQQAVASELWMRIFEGQPQHYQEILRLRWQGLNNEQVAERMGLSVRHVRRIITHIFEGVGQT